MRSQCDVAHPHEGYQILKKWRDYFLTKSLADPQMSAHLKDLNEQIINGPRTLPLSVALPTGPVFVYSTNVDRFFLRAGFDDAEVLETHGNYEEFQCSGLKREREGNLPSYRIFDRPCCTQTWKLPEDFDFGVDASSFTAQNFPLCPSCGMLARPRVYMFGDSMFLPPAQEDVFFNCMLAVSSLLKGNPSLSLALLEVGVGLRLPKIRKCFEGLLHRFPSQVSIIRINPSLPSSSLSSHSSLISLPLSSYEALKSIDEKLKMK